MTEEPTNTELLQRLTTEAVHEAIQSTALAFLRNLSNRGASDEAMYEVTLESPGIACAALSVGIVSVAMKTCRDTDERVRMLTDVHKQMLKHATDPVLEAQAVIAQDEVEATLKDMINYMR